MISENQTMSSYMMPNGSYITHISNTSKSENVKTNPLDKYLNFLGFDISKISLNSYINYMPDFSRFCNLIHLDISHSQIKNIPFIPPTVEIFICNNNKLSLCPKLNECLRILDLSHNFITEMPEFTDNLEIVNLDGNLIKFLRKINNGLLYLSVTFNCLIRLPFLPDTLRILHLDYNKQLCNIPMLSESIELCTFENTRFYDKIVAYYHKDISYYNYDGFICHNMQYIKNYTKKLSESIIRNKSWFRRYVWSIREKVTKKKFSPDNFKIFLETFDPNNDEIIPETIEWYDDLIKKWNSDHSYDNIYPTVNYIRNNEQMHEDLINYVNNNIYLCYYNEPVRVFLNEEVTEHIMDDMYDYDFYDYFSEEDDESFHYDSERDDESYDQEEYIETLISRYNKDEQ